MKFFCLTKDKFPNKTLSYNGIHYKPAVDTIYQLRKQGCIYCIVTGVVNDKAESEITPIVHLTTKKVPKGDLYDVQND